MIELSEQHFMYVDTCPWCGATSKEMLYQNHYMAKAQKCLKCGFVYSDKILNKSGLNAYWSQYLSEVQRKDEEAVSKRNINVSVGISIY